MRQVTKFLRGKKETHAARWGLLRGFSICSNEVGGLRYGRLNPKGVLPPE